MRLLRAAVAATLMLFANTITGRAATVFFYSEPEQYYGWAAGYSYSRAENYAHEGCNEGGKQCKFVLECDGGWAAVAFADDFARAAAFSCGYKTALGARVAALISCTAQARTLCWTMSTISNSGNARSDKDNREFDMAWYVQEMLYYLKYEPGNADGQMGGKTRTALKAFQTKLGREPTGKLDDEIFVRLLDSVGGRIAVSDGMKTLAEADKEEYAKATYVSITAPFTGATFSEEIATRNEADRRMTLATMLSSWGTPCTLPAKSAEAVPPDGTGGWLVGCNEGDWTVLMGKGTHTIMGGFRQITVENGVVTASGPDSGGTDAGGTDTDAPKEPGPGTEHKNPDQKSDSDQNIPSPKTDKNSLQ